MLPALQVLTSALNLILRPENWCVKFLYTESSDGTIAYCARGAILVAAFKSTETTDDDSVYCHELMVDIPTEDLKSQIEEVKDLLALKVSPIYHVATWNNTHSHKEVVALFKRAISRLKRQQLINDMKTSPTVASSLEKV